MYVRPPSAYHSGPVLPQGEWKPERWVIVFEGGGGCIDADACLERWCGLVGMDRASAMSTRGSHQALAGASGILRRDPAVNRFAGYNHVYLNYCTSDQYIGSQAHLGLASNGTTYDIQFNGEAIVNDAFARLLDPAGVAPDVATFWADRLPSLRTAEEIVLVGISAGGGGLRHHLDRLRDMLVQEVYGQVRVVGVIDAGNAPGFWDPTFTWGAVGAPSSYQDMLVGWMEPPVRTFWGADDTALDASCLDPGFAAAHAADGGSHPQVCYDTTYTLFNHITTPFFVRQDVNDPLAREVYLDWQLLPGLPAYWQAQRGLLGGLVGFAGRLEPVAMPPGVFGPKCDEHVSTLSNHFFGQAVRLPGNVMGTTFHDLLDNWMAGLAPFTELQTDGDPGPAHTPSFCP
jgi:hypothetical protein